MTYTTAKTGAQIDAALAKTDALSNRNLIINGDFDIWQRGTSFSNSEGDYGADRWLCDNVQTVERSTDVPNSRSKYSLQFNRSGTSSFSQYQFIEAAIARSLVGKKVVGSFWAKGSAEDSIRLRIFHADSEDDFSARTFIKGSPSQTLNTSWTHYIFAFDELPESAKNGIRVDIRAGNLGDLTTNLAQVQFEAGTVATEFEPRPVGMELALCQRYYQLIDMSGNFIIPMSRFNQSTGNPYCAISLLNTMRTPPTVSFSSGWNADAGYAGDPTLRNVTLSALSLNGTESCAANEVLYLSGGSIYLDAEL